MISSASVPDGRDGIAPSYLGRLFWSNIVIFFVTAAVAYERTHICDEARNLVY